LQLTKFAAGSGLQETAAPCRFGISDPMREPELPPFVEAAADAADGALRS
jgi:hypothetical protein